MGTDRGINISHNFFLTALHANIWCHSCPNIQAGGTSHPVLLLRDHQRFGEEKGASIRERGEGRADLRSVCLLSQLQVSHFPSLSTVTAPATIFLDFPS